MTASRKKTSPPSVAESANDPAAAQAVGNTTEHIVVAVTRAIVEHRLLPGAKLVEQKLADRFGVSRTIVRQALFRLSQLKLVRLEQARGAFVAEPSIEEAREVFAVRRMVEGQMVRQLIAQIKPADLKLLKAHLKAERDAVARIDVATRTKLLFDFHVCMAQALGNQVLVDLIQELVSRCSLITLMYQSADDAEASNAEHVDILKAIEARDADLAADLIDRHLLTVERQLTERRRVPTLRIEDALLD
ncbi:GntR family transcriptional regulator [Aquabacterium lacunae]|uniref:GntR family transcriptional regulator n=1 Tax=Aquabacterium lacunae TaxID=2528630 RepID=A0A4Q9H079_9BURK|nr:GntR family transcriptional regulator [Aquabacterium lacunae]TBO32542.1 GntR family transcriptional regulator [Aquabacterium lacunae]